MMTIRQHLEQRAQSLRLAASMHQEGLTAAEARLREVEDAIEALDLAEQSPSEQHPGERIIRALEGAGRPLPISEIAHRASLTRQQVSDHVGPLLRAGDIQRVSRGVYRRAR